MRIPSGSLDRKMFFVAVDVTDLKTRETALTGFTVYRSRDGGTATLYTTPTIVELSAANMPGVYALTIDEDTTIGGTHDTEEYCVHITQASMAPVTRVIDVYRVKFTEGQAATIASNRMDASAQVVLDKTGYSVGSGGITATSFAAGAIDAAAIAADASEEILKAASGTADSGTTTTMVDAERTEAGTDYWKDMIVLFTSGTNIGLARRVSAFDPATDTLTFGVALPNAVAVGHTYIILRTAIQEAAGAGATDWSAAERNQIRDALGVDGTKTAAIGGQLQVIDDFVDTEVAAIKAKTDQLTFTVANKVDAGIVAAADFAQGAADKVWSSATRTLTAFSTALALSVWDVLETAILTASSIGLKVKNNLDAAVSTRSSHSAADVWASVTRALTDKAGFGLAAAEYTSIADGLLKRDLSAVTGEAVRSVLNAIRFLRNKWSISGTTLTVTKEDDTTAAWTATLTATAGANPITAKDPVE